MNEEDSTRLEEFRQFKKEIRGSAEYLLVGMDVAKDKHYAFFGMATGKTLFRRLVFENDLEGFRKLLVQAEAMKVQNGLKRVVFGMEPTSNYDVLHLVEIAQGLGRKGGLNLFKDGIDGVVEWRPFEDPDQVLVKVKGHEFGQSKRGRNLKFEGVYESPAIGFFNFLGVQGKPGHLEGFQVPIDRAYPCFFPLRDLCYGQTVRAGLDCPDDTPLPG